MYFQVYFHPTARVYELMLKNIFKRILFLLNTNYLFKTDLTIIKELFNQYSVETYLQLDDYYVNGMILRLQTEKDEILSCLCQDFVNRKLFKYLIVDENNREKTIKIRNYYRLFEAENYFTAGSVVSQEAYKNEKLDLNEILIIDQNNQIKPLTQVSKIVQGLIETGKKSLEIFIYKDYENV